MRLTVNLDDDVYVLARSFARAEDCAIGTAVNRLLRRAVEARPAAPAGRRTRRNGFAVSRGRRIVTADTVLGAEAEDART